MHSDDISITIWKCIMACISELEAMLPLLTITTALKALQSSRFQVAGSSPAQGRFSSTFFTSLHVCMIIYIMLNNNYK